MKILIVGNLGYIGPSVGAFPESCLNGVDVVLNLAAISNDPMGNEFEKITMDVNYGAAITIAEAARRHGVRNYVYASSCSIYGAGGDSAKVESDSLKPLTAYARSKVAAEQDLAPLATNDFVVTCLRFATACGFSDRVRLDLVLNDFVAGALVNKRIDILSDGSPWRRLFNTKDMARAFHWAAQRRADCGGKFLAVNTGSSDWNVQIKDLAAVSNTLSGTSFSVNKEASPDKRSYRVNFDLFKQLAPDHQPLRDLPATIRELSEGLSAMNFADANFRESQFIRLKVLARLRDRARLDGDLCWTGK